MVQLRIPHPFRSCFSGQNHSFSCNRLQLKRPNPQIGSGSLAFGHLLHILLLCDLSQYTDCKPNVCHKPDYFILVKLRKSNTAELFIRLKLDIFKGEAGKYSFIVTNSYILIEHFICKINAREKKHPSILYVRKNNN